MLAALFTCLWSVGPVVLQGTSTCPTPAQVEERLALVWEQPAAEPAANAQDRVVLERRQGQLLITLHRPDGTQAGQRTFSASSTCADLAQAAAVVVAAWEINLHPELAPGTPSPQPQPAAALEVSTRALPALPVVPATAPQHVTHELGIAVGPSYASTMGWQAGALYEAHLGAWGLRLAPSWERTRNENLLRGQARWARYAAGLGAAHQTLLPHAFGLEGYGEANLGWLRFAGSGFSRNTESQSFDPAGRVGLRLFRMVGHWRLWADMSATWRWRVQRAYADPGKEAIRLPPVFIGALLGLGWRS